MPGRHSHAQVRTFARIMPFANEVACASGQCPVRLRGWWGWPMPGEGFEPPTFGLQNRCTTTVLTRRAALV